MAIVWQNTFDGTSGNVTVANSANYGDQVSSVTQPATYQTAQRAHGPGAMALGSPTAGGQVRWVLGETAPSAWSARFYMRMSADQVFRFVLDGPTQTVANLSTSASYISRILGQDVPAAVMTAITGTWTRLEFTWGSGQGGSVVRLWWSDPNSTDEPDYETTGGIYTGTHLGFDSGILSAYGVTHVDSVVVTDEKAWIGPYEPPTETVWQNTFDGPDFTAITPANSADYGDPIEQAVNTVNYSTDWFAHGSASARLGTGDGATGGSFSTQSTAQADWSLRAYLNIPAGGWELLRTYTASDQPIIVNLDSDQDTWEILGQDVSAYAANLGGQPIRVEAAKLGSTATVKVWWVNPDSDGVPDLQVSSYEPAWDGLDGVGAEGGGFSTPPTYIDELVVAQGAWIGPVDTGVAVEAAVAFLGAAEGTVDVAGFVQIGTEFSGTAEGTKSGTSGSVEHTVEYNSVVEHDARELGLAIADVVYSGEAVGAPERDTDVSAEVEYSGEVVWETSRASEGDADVVYLPEAQGESRVTLPDVTRVGLRYRLVAYDPNGVRRGQLPLPLNFQMGVPLNDLPSLNLEYLKSAPGFGLLDKHCEVAVEVSTLTSPTYTEYPGCRFINIRNHSDPAERTGNVKYTMPHYGWQLRKARVLVGLDEDGQRSFTNATFGRIMETFLIEAQTRGWNPGMSWDFTPQRDSAGQVWDNVYTVSFDAGQDLWTILETFAQQAACDFRWDKRTLQVYNSDTALNRDRSNAAVLQLGRDITSAPNDWTSEELAARILVRGDEGSSVMMTVNDAQRPWGFWENYISQSGVTDTGTLTTLAQWSLQKARQPLVQMTRGILFPTAEYMPFRDYQPGDYIMAPGDPDRPWGLASQAQLRVRQITLVSVDGQGMEGGLVLNERFIENALRRDRLLNALTGGAGSNPGGGGGGRPPSEDTRNPRAPLGLVVNSETYINEIGEPRGQITATWQLVDEATNGTDMDITAYEVWVRWAAMSQPWQLWTTVDDPTNQAFMSPFNPDEVYEVRVRAVGRNLRRSAFSTTVPILVQGDHEPPDIPSAPILESRLGVVRATWNGLDFQGLPMAADFDYVAVWMSETASIEDGWERIDTLYRTGVSVIPDLEYDTLFYFRFTAIDRSGNESEPSSINSISVQQLVSGDITPGSIGYELLAEGAVRDDILADDAVRNRHIAAGQITGEKIRAYSIFADRIAVGNTRNLLTDPKNLDEDLNDLRLSLTDGTWTYENNTEHAQNSPTLSRDDNPNGTYRYYWIQSVEAESINDLNAGYRVQSEVGRAVSTTLLTISGRTSGVLAVAGFMRLLDREGNLVGQPATTTEHSLSSNVTDYELISNNGAEIPPAAVSAVHYVRVVMTGVNVGTTISFARTFSALNDGQVLIENGAITANKISANAITADKIDVGAVTAVAIAADAITTDKLAANAITAKHTITGALIQTTASANRGLKISSTGMQGFDSLGNQTFNYQSATGNVAVTGRFQTGVATGNRVVVDSNLYAGRPAIQLHTGTTAQVQPVMYSMGANSQEYQPGSLLIHGRETTVNSSGRNTLQLKAGTGAGAGGASLAREYGIYGGVGFAYESWNAIINGRMRSGSISISYEFYGRTGTFTSGTEETVNVTYGSAATTGSRMVMLTSVSNTTADVLTATGVHSATLSGCRVGGRNVANATGFRLNYLVKWVAGPTG